MYVEFLRMTYQVSEAGDGVAALQQIVAEPPDVVVTDLALPRMDGFELLSRIRADRRTANLPVIALSGYSGPEYDERIRMAGTTLVLMKPCMPDALVEAINKVLATGHRSQA
jgi:two-component system, cell cycle response regulator DivK